MSCRGRRRRRPWLARCGAAVRGATAAGAAALFRYRTVLKCEISNVSNVALDPGRSLTFDMSNFAHAATVAMSYLPRGGNTRGTVGGAVSRSSVRRLRQVGPLKQKNSTSRGGATRRTHRAILQCSTGALWFAPDRGRLGFRDIQGDASLGPWC